MTFPPADLLSLTGIGFVALFALWKTAIEPRWPPRASARQAAET